MESHYLMVARLGQILGMAMAMDLGSGSLVQFKEWKGWEADS